MPGTAKECYERIKIALEANFQKLPEFVRNTLVVVGQVVFNAVALVAFLVGFFFFCLVIFPLMGPMGILYCLGFFYFDIQLGKDYLANGKTVPGFVSECTERIAKHERKYTSYIQYRPAPDSECYVIHGSERAEREAIGTPWEVVVLPERPRSGRLKVEIDTWMEDIKSLICALVIMGPILLVTVTFLMGPVVWYNVVFGQGFRPESPSMLDRWILVGIAFPLAFLILCVRHCIIHWCCIGLGRVKLVAENKVVPQLDFAQKGDQKIDNNGEGKKSDQVVPQLDFEQEGGQNKMDNTSVGKSSDASLHDMEGGCKTGGMGGSE